jgi:hypothetical protein
MVNYVNLYELVQLHNDEALSERYVRYLSNFSDEKMYHHHEITAINRLLGILKLEPTLFDNFLYSYSLPQLSKEFDLMCITDKYVLNIELKSINTGDKIFKQLRQNAYFLKMLNKDIIEYCYVDEDQKLYKYQNSKLIESSFDEIQMFLSLNKKHIKMDLDQIYDVGSVLISPLKEPMRFIEDNYILTENQESNKKNILAELEGNNQEYVTEQIKDGEGNVQGYQQLGTTQNRTISFDPAVMNSEEQTAESREQQQYYDLYQGQLEDSSHVNEGLNVAGLRKSNYGRQMDHYNQALAYDILVAADTKA